MFCPNCKTEYVIGILVCADCETNLVPVLPPDDDELEAPQEDLVTILQTRDQSLIPLIKSMLEDAGIEYSVEGELPLVHLSIGWVKIRVNERDEAAAKDIIESLNSPPPMGLEEEHGQPEDSR